MRRTFVAVAAALVVAVAVVVGVATAGPAAACGGLVGDNGTIQLLRTSTLAAYTDGVEHYVTSFQFAGGGAELGSIVPLPDIPTEVERGGAWTLQRLQQEVQTVDPQSAAGGAGAERAYDSSRARVILETRIDALDITILEGGGTAVGDWARENGFRLTPDAPEVLDFYADRSPIFMAARFDATAAREAGQGIGDGTPIHLTIPTDDPWVPLRILGLGRQADERIEADVFLLTEREPTLLGGVGDELALQRSETASDLLLDDLRSDDGMAWVPDSMWLTYLQVDAPAGDLTFDLAVDPSGAGRPSLLDAGMRLDSGIVPEGDDSADTGLLLPAAVAVGVALLGAAAVVWWARRPILP